MNFRRFISVLLATCLLFAFVSCNEAAEDTSSVLEASSDVVSVAPPDPIEVVDAATEKLFALDNLDLEGTLILDYNYEAPEADDSLMGEETPEEDTTETGSTDAVFRFKQSGKEKATATVTATDAGISTTSNYYFSDEIIYYSSTDGTYKAKGSYDEFLGYIVTAEPTPDDAYETVSLEEADGITTVKFSGYNKKYISNYASLVDLPDGCIEMYSCSAEVKINNDGYMISSKTNFTCTGTYLGVKVTFSMEETMSVYNLGQEISVNIPVGLDDYTEIAKMQPVFDIKNGSKLSNYYDTDSTLTQKLTVSDGDTSEEISSVSNYKASFSTGKYIADYSTTIEFDGNETKFGYTFSDNKLTFTVDNSTSDCSESDALSSVATMQFFNLPSNIDDIEDFTVDLENDDGSYTISGEIDEFMGYMAVFLQYSYLYGSEAANDLISSYDFTANKYEFAMQFDAEGNMIGYSLSLDYDIVYYGEILNINCEYILDVNSYSLGE